MFHYSGLENSLECIVLGVAESDTMERLSHTFSADEFYFLRAVEGRDRLGEVVEALANTLAPWCEELTHWKRL